MDNNFEPQACEESEDDTTLDRALDPQLATDHQQQEEMKESMTDLLNNCQDVLEALSREKQDRIQTLIEDLTNEKYEKVAELKASFDFMIKRLEQQKQKDKAEAKRAHKDEEVRQLQDQMDACKRGKMEELNREYEERRREAL